MKSQKVEIRHILVKSERTAVLRNKNNLWPQVPRPSIKLISRPEMLPHPPLPVRRPQRPPMRHHRLSCPHHIFKAVNRIIFNKLQYVLGSVGLLSFYFGGAKLLRFLAKTKHAPRKLSYFVNKHNAESTNIGHKSNFGTFWGHGILCIFIKDNNFLGAFSILEKNLTNFNPPK